MLSGLMRHLLFLLLFCGASLLHGQILNFRSFGLEEGLPAAGAYDFCTGPDGMLWIATDGGGVCAFDGREFYRHTTEDGLNASVIRLLCRDSLDRVWAVTPTNEIFVWTSDWQKFEPEGGISFGEIYALSAGPGDLVYMATSQGVATIKNHSVQLPEWNAGLPEPDVRDILVRNDTVWMATDKGLVYETRGELYHFKADSIWPSAKIIALGTSQSGSIWAGTSAGLVSVSGKLVKPFRHNDQLEVKRIRSVYEAFDGTLWLGTYNGVVRLRPENDFRPELIDTENGLSDNRVRKVFQDPSGSIWFATYLGGVSQLTSTAFEHFTPDPARKFAFSAIAENDENVFYAGVFENGIACIRANRIKWVHRGDFSVRSISRPFNGVNWVVHNEGLGYLSAEQFYSFSLPDTLANSFLHHCEIQDDRLFVSYHNFILSRPADPAVNEPFKIVAGFESPGVILDFELLRDSAIWAITDQQLGFWRKAWEEPRFLPIESTEFEGAEFTDLAIDDFGQVWAGTMNKGLFRLYQGRISHLHEENGLQSNRIHQLVFDHMENLWIGGLQGVTQIVLTAGNELVEQINHFSFQDGLRSAHTHLRAGYCDSQERLWFGTLDGITNYSKPRKVSVPAPPEIAIRSIDLFFDPQTNWLNWCDSLDLRGLPVSLELPHNQNHLTFHFRGISLVNPSAVRYQYKLEGLEDWSPITSNAEMTYPNLPPGEYRFLVQARSASGIWTPEPAVFSFIVKKPFYATWWFIALCVVFILIMVWYILRWREQRFERERRVLEKEVSLRTAELRLEVEKSDKLLLNILPEDAAKELKEKGRSDARHYRGVSVLFTDFEGFTNLAEKLSSSELVATLDECFRAFDDIIEQLGLEKIKTIGDAYMCAAGLRGQDPQHADNAVRAGLEMQRFMEGFNNERKLQGKPVWPLRVGIHSGPVVAGIVGRKKFAYDIWGDTVNLASRIESAGEPGKVNISSVTRELLQDKDFETTPRGKIEVKNKGAIEMYFVKLNEVSAN
jgi:class 3 adenylate cyclase/sugar lactone lactonase YvrE